MYLIILDKMKTEYVGGFGSLNAALKQKRRDMTPLNHFFKFPTDFAQIFRGTFWYGKFDVTGSTRLKAIGEKLGVSDPPPSQRSAC